MGRPLRIEYAGGKYHVINRGNYRQNIFSEKGAAEAFERVLGEAACRYGWRIHAYVIMIKPEDVRKPPKTSGLDIGQSGLDPGGEAE